MTKDQEKTLEAARLAAERSYSPYSHYRVGAAVLAGSEIFAGTNIENASSNLGICAERIAIAHARMHGKSEIEGIAIFCVDATVDENGDTNLHECLPCGGCRQWLAELAPDLWIVTNGSEKVFSLPDLLPLPFRLP